MWGGGEAEMGVLPQVSGCGGRHRKERGVLWVEPGLLLLPSSFLGPTSPTFPPHSLPPGSHSHLDLAPTPGEEGGPLLSLLPTPLLTLLLGRDHPLCDEDPRGPSRE